MSEGCSCYLAAYWFNMYTGGLTISNEDKLTLYLACSGENAWSDKIKDILITELDWRLVIGRIVHNRVVSSCYQSLRQLANTTQKNLVPQKILKRLRELNHPFIGYSIILHEETKIIFKSLKSAGIEFTPMKGILLAETVYPEKHLRFIRDIDLLFPSIAELQRAEALMPTLGYESVYSYDRETLLRKTRSVFAIECDMHRSLSFFHYFEYPSKIKSLWETASEKRVGGVKVRVMNAEHMLLVLCLHSFYDGCILLKDLCDVIQILRTQPRLDWQFIAQQLKEFPCAFGIPLRIIDEMLKDFFNVNFLPKTMYRALHNDNGMLSKINWNALKQELGTLQFPFYYGKFCPQNCIYCPRYLRDNVESTDTELELNKSTNNPMHKLKRVLLDYYFILTIVRKKQGIKHALKSLYQQSAGLLSWLLIVKQWHPRKKIESA